MPIAGNFQRERYQNQFGLCACILVVACGMQLLYARWFESFAGVWPDWRIVFSSLKLPAERALPHRKVHRVSAR